MQLLHGRHIAHGATAHLCRLSRTQLPRHYASRSVVPSSPRWYASLNLTALDKKWRARWQESADQEEAISSTSKDSKYVVPMFPYPSGTLHLGHLRVYTIADVVARFRSLHGDNVVLPMGWDAFGLPAENAALERGIAPGAWTTSNIAKMKEQLEVMNGSWKWDRVRSMLLPYLNRWLTIVFSGVGYLRPRILQTHTEALHHALREGPRLPSRSRGQL